MARIVKKKKPFIKKMQPETVEAKDSKFESMGEKPKWTRPEHKIERNLEEFGVERFVFFQTVEVFFVVQQELSTHEFVNNFSMVRRVYHVTIL